MTGIEGSIIVLYGILLAGVGYLRFSPRKRIRTKQRSKQTAINKGYEPPKVKLPPTKNYPMTG